MLRLAFVCSLIAAAAACAKKNEEGTASGSATTTTTTTTTTTVTTGSGSAMAGSGSDMAAGSGSAMAGSGSDMAAGSGSAMGSGSDVAMGSGSATGSDAGSGAGAGSAAVKFDKLSREDQIKFMKTNVVPPMKAAFQKFDSKAFANFGCKTCHGKDPQKAKYKMPSSDIPALDFDALKKGEDKEIAEFMSKVVKPEMAKILGEPEMTEHTQGFGCLECHTQKKKG